MEEGLQLKPSASHWMPHYQAANCSGVFISGMHVAHSFRVRRTEFLWYFLNILWSVNARWSWLICYKGTRAHQNSTLPHPQKKKPKQNTITTTTQQQKNKKPQTNPNNTRNIQKSHKAFLGSRLQDDAPLGGSRAADLTVRYQHCPSQSVLQDSYLAVAHTDTPSSKGP